MPCDYEPKESVCKVFQTLIFRKMGNDTKGTSAAQSTNTIFSEERKQRIVLALNTYILETKQSQNEAAVKIGVSSTYLGQMRNGNFSMSDETWQKVYSHVAQYITFEWKLLATTNYATSIKTCERARDGKVILYLLGPQGNGKTTALKRAEAKFNQEGVTEAFYYECLSSDSPSGMIKGILKILGVKFKGNTGECVRRVAQEFNAMKNPILLIDEAGVLNERRINLLKDLNNLTVGKLGMVIAGVNYCYNEIVKEAEAQTAGLPEFESRIAYPSVLERVTKEEFIKICAANGISNTNVSKWLHHKTKCDLRKLAYMVGIIHRELGADVDVQTLEQVFK